MVMMHTESEERLSIIHGPTGGSFRRASFNPRSPHRSPRSERDLNAPTQAALERAEYWDDYGVKTGMEIAFGLTDPSSNKGEWEVSEEERPEKWSSVCLHFTQNTTFHGINKITESTPFPIRRFIWVFIILGGLSLFLTQMARSIMHYLDHPVTVNTKIIYTKAIPFPAVTICNQNVFRMSEAASHGYYKLIDNIFSHDSITDVNLTMSEYNVTMRDLYDITAHNKHDMIIGCIWDREACTAKDFETTITEHGVCYTFNGGKTKTPRVASQTGSDRGLRLKLNIEKYEYMRGPNSAAGVKILIHDRAEVPFVRDFGQAISPGSHAFVGIQKIRITNLESPYGECQRDMDLQFFRNYTLPNCLVDCLANFLRKNCLCRLPHMPEFFLHPVRFEEAQKSEDEYDTDKCRCPVPCERSKYETAMSYGSMSHVDNIQQDNHQDIQTRFIRARETLQRVDPYIIEKDITMVTALEEAMEEVAMTFEEIENKMENVSWYIDRIMSRMDQRIHFHQEQALRAVEKAVLYGFVQPFDIDQQNYFEPLSTGSRQLLKRYRRTLGKMLNVSSSSRDLRRILLWQIEEDLSSRLDLATKSRHSLTGIHKSLSEGEALLPYNWSLSKRYDKKSVPRELLRHDIAYQKIIYTYLVNNMDGVIMAIKQLQHMAKHVYRKNEYNETLLHEIRSSYMDGIKAINYGHNLFKEAVVYKTKALITERIAKFNKQVETLRRERSDVNITVQNCFSLVKNMKNNAWPSLVEILNVSSDYTVNKTCTKTQLAEIVTSQMLDLYTQHAEDFFSDVRARARNFDHDWQKFRDALIAVWKGIKYEQTTQELYTKISQDFLQIFYTDNAELKERLIEPFNRTLGVSDPAELYYMTNADMMNIDPMRHVADRLGKFERFRSESDLTAVINGKDDRFMKAMNTWEASLRAFTEGSKLDNGFFKDNFLEVDVYMTELYFELVEQRVAYDLTHLWSDIGGSMGLFVGASVITVFELLDAILHNFLKVQLQETKQRRRSMAIARSHSQSKKSQQTTEAGLVVAVTWPCFNEGKLLGVVGLDIYASDMLESATYFNKPDKTSYAFIIDNKGYAVMHPHLSRPIKTNTQPLYTDISQFEHYSQFADVRQMMLAHEQGIQHIEVPRHHDNASHMNDLMSSNYLRIRYMWKKIKVAKMGGASPFIIVIKTIQDGFRLRDNIKPSNESPQRPLVYHRLDLLPSVKTCLHLKQFATLETSTLFLAGNSFKQPFIHISQEETKRMVQNYLAYLNDNTNLVSNPGFRPDIKEDVIALSRINHPWLKQFSRSRMNDFIVRRYVASPSGVMRMFPGSLLDKNYDPSKRDWYTRAMLYPGKVTLTAPYLDKGGAGYIVTVSHTIYEGKAAALHGPFDRVVAVMGIDLTLGYFYRLLVQQIPLCEKKNIRCFIMDDRGYLIAHPGLIEADGRGPVEQQHITRKEPLVANDILTHEGFVKKQLCNRYTDRTIQRYYHFNTSVVRVLTNLVHGEHYSQYQVVPIPGTNAFIGIVNDTRDMVRAFCPCSMYDRQCLNCHRMEQTECECPCECALEMDFCSGHLLEEEDKNPSCAPHPEEPEIVKVSEELAQQLSQCRPTSCSAYTNQRSCLGIVDCQWCALESDGTTALVEPFCSSQRVCFAGVLSAKTPYGDEVRALRSSEAVTAKTTPVGPVAGGIMGCFLVLALGVYCYRHHVHRNSHHYIASLPDNHMRMNQLDNDLEEPEQSEDPTAGHTNIVLATFDNPAATISPYRVNTTYRRPTGGDSDHGYSTMTPHEDSEQASTTCIEPLIIGRDRYRPNSSNAPKSTPMLPPPPPTTHNRRSRSPTPPQTQLPKPATIPEQTASLLGVPGQTSIPETSLSPHHVIANVQVHMVDTH